MRADIITFIFLRGKRIEKWSELSHLQMVSNIQFDAPATRTVYPSKITIIITTF